MKKKEENKKIENKKIRKQPKGKEKNKEGQPSE